MRGLVVDYRDALRKEREKWARHLADGKAKDWEDYKRITGLIQGLRDAEYLFNDTVKKYLEEEEAEE